MDKAPVTESREATDGNIERSSNNDVIENDREDIEQDDNVEKTVVTPRFHPNWNNPSVVESKKTFFSFRKLKSSKKEKDVVIEAKTTRNVVETTTEPNDVDKELQKENEVRRMGSLNIAIVDRTAECNKSIQSGEPNVPSGDDAAIVSTGLSWNSCENNEKISTEKEVKSDDEDSPPESLPVQDSTTTSATCSMFTEIGTMFQQAGSYAKVSAVGIMERVSSGMCDKSEAEKVVVAETSPDNVEEKEVVSTVEESVDPAVAAATSPDVEEKEVVSTVEENVVLDEEAAIVPEVDVVSFETKPIEEEVTPVDAPSVDGIQSIAKSIASALEVALEGVSNEGETGVEAKTIKDETQDAAFADPLKIGRNRSISFMGNSLAESTYASVKTMAETVFSALEVALDGTAGSSQHHLVFKPKESEVVVAEEKSVGDNNHDEHEETDSVADKSFVSASEDAVEVMSSQEQDKLDESSNKLEENADGAKSTDDEARVDAACHAEAGKYDKNVDETVSESGERSQKMTVDVNGSAIGPKSPVSPSSICTSVVGSTDNMDLFDVDDKKPARETRALSTEEGEQDQTIGKALLDSILYNLARAEVAATSDGNTDKQVKIHLLRSKLLRLTNRNDKWATQLEGGGEPDDIFVRGTVGRLMAPVLQIIQNVADMIDRVVLDGNTACMMGTADLIDHQCVSHGGSQIASADSASQGPVVVQDSNDGVFTA